MRLIFYALVIFNIAILLLNWDSISSINKGSRVIEAPQGEALTLANAEQLPITPRRQPPPPPPSQTTTVRLIDQVLDFFAEMWRLLREVILPPARDLPVESTPSDPAQAPAPAEPAVAAYCLDLGGYASAEQAVAFKNTLAARGMLTELRPVAGKAQPNGKFIVIARVRASLGTAKELSEHLSSHGIANRIKENRPLGYLLQSSVFSSRAAAQRAWQKIDDLGMSAYIELVDDGTPSPATTLYYLRLGGASVTRWNQLNAGGALQRLAGGEVQLQRVDSC